MASYCHEISRLLNQSEKLTVEYLDLFKKYLKGDHWPEAYVELLEQLKALIAEEDIEMRIRSYYGKLENYDKQGDRNGKINGESVPGSGLFISSGFKTK